MYFNLPESYDLKTLHLCARLLEEVTEAGTAFREHGDEAADRLVDLARHLGLQTDCLHDVLTMGIVSAMELNRREVEKEGSAV